MRCLPRTDHSQQLRLRCRKHHLVRRLGAGRKCLLCHTSPPPPHCLNKFSTPSSSRRGLSLPIHMACSKNIKTPWMCHHQPRAGHRRCRRKPRTNSNILPTPQVYSQRHWRSSNHNNSPKFSTRRTRSNSSSTLRRVLLACQVPSRIWLRVSKVRSKRVNYNCSTSIIIALIVL